MGLGREQRGGIGKGAEVSGVHTHVHWDRKICKGGGGEFGEGLLDCGSGLGAWGLWEGPQQHTLLLAIL